MTNATLHPNSEDKFSCLISVSVCIYEMCCNVLICSRRIQQRSWAIEDRNKKLKDSYKQRNQELFASKIYQVLFYLYVFI